MFANFRLTTISGILFINALPKMNTLDPTHREVPKAHNCTRENSRTGFCVFSRLDRAETRFNLAVYR